MKEIKKIDVLSAGKIVGILYALMGLIIGVFITLFLLIGLPSYSEITGLSGVLFGLIFGVGSIIFLPIFYGIFGFITGLIIALLYNFIVKFVGGIKIELG